MALHVYAMLDRDLGGPPPGPPSPYADHLVRHMTAGVVVLRQAAGEYLSLWSDDDPDMDRAISAAGDVAAVLQSALRQPDAFVEPAVGLPEPLELIDALEGLLYSLILLTDPPRRPLALTPSALEELLSTPTVGGLLNLAPRE